MRYAAFLLPIALADASAQLRTVSAGVGGHYVEPHIAGNPHDPNELVVASMVVADLDTTRWRVRVFWSNDAGERWQAAALPTKDGFGCSADAWLAWGRARNVYLSCLAAVTSANGRDFNFRIWLHASSDGGRTWAPPVELLTQPVGEWDHPVLSLAPLHPNARRDTLFVVGTRPRSRGNGFGIARYIEGEARFGPLRVYEPPEQRNDNFGSAVAMDTETVVLTYFAMLGNAPRPLFSVFAKDTTMRRTPLRDDVMPWGFPMLTRRGGRTGFDLLVAAWLESDSQQSLDVMLGISSDTARTWNTIAVTKGGSPHFRARPNVVADARGNLAVTWFEANSVSPCGDVVLAARSADDANSFTELARVPTTEAACGLMPADSLLIAIVNRWRAGGDYSGIHAAAAGVFDIVWADVRQDGFQIRFLRTRAPQRWAGPMR